MIWDRLRRESNTGRIPWPWVCVFDSKKKEKRKKEEEEIDNKTPSRASRS